MIKIYGTKTCSYCTRAKDLCSVNNIPFVEINNYKTVPQIWDDEHYVGGYTDLVQYVSKQKGTASLV